jgi:hypothetical protein
MLLHAIPLDARMTVAAALRRLAAAGLWLDSNEPHARSWIETRAAALKRTPDEIVRLLERNPDDFGAAIRRQLYTNILWYARPVREVLNLCVAAAPDDSLDMVLALREEDSRPPLSPPGIFRNPRTDRFEVETPDREGVVLHGVTPWAVSLLAPDAGVDFSKGAPNAEVLLGGGTDRSFRSRGPAPAAAAPEAAKPVELTVWPRITAPDYVPAKVAFKVIIGFATEQQAGVFGGWMTLRAPEGVKTIAVTVEVIVDGVDAAAWSQVIDVPVDKPTIAQAEFMLTGREPAGTEPVHLTTIEVRYLLDGAVVGTASKPLVIGRASDPEMLKIDPNAQFGKPWLSQPATASSLSLQPDPHVADLTIELAKPDRNFSTGVYVCKLYSPHPIKADKGPHTIDFGDDAKTFARSIVEGMRQYSGTELVDNWLRSVGGLVTDKLPPSAIDALREVAAIVAPNPPAVLLVSAEPYVPWELALLDPPLDDKCPPFLGAQALVGRWFRDGAAASASAPSPSTSPARASKPPASPPGTIPVKNMAVMAGKYKAQSGLLDLPGAEAEAESLVKAYDAIALPASVNALRQLLAARLQRNFEEIGGAGAVHFAGHGNFDPARPDSSVMFLSDGMPLSSLLFRSAAYGQDLLPFIFLNACMIGIGGEVLGDMGGFPGNCLRGGFGAVLGALWEVDDTVASGVALEFWRRALPRDNGGKPEPVAAILRDLRARYACEPGEAPVSTWLAYTYYGHPRLMLQRA